MIIGTWPKTEVVPNWICGSKMVVRQKNRKKIQSEVVPMHSENHATRFFIYPVGADEAGDQLIQLWYHQYNSKIKKTITVSVLLGPFLSSEVQSDSVE